MASGTKEQKKAVKSLLKNIKAHAAGQQLFTSFGRVTHVVGTIIRGSVRDVKIGELCYLKNANDEEYREAEVIGITQDGAILMPLKGLGGISLQTTIHPTGTAHSIYMGDHLLGRVVDGLGHPIDGGPEFEGEGVLRTIAAHNPISPMERTMIEQPMMLGVKAIDGLLTCGDGQRIGIFAGAGCGKSTLLGMIVKGSQSDVSVIALVGERGREVREFIEHSLGEEGMKKAVVVAATSDKSSIERMKAAYMATTIAEFFRDQGKRVILMVDSTTRLARAFREIGLAAGEPPARRGYPPSVFAQLPQVLERSGRNKNGSITAFYTVLLEGEDTSADPIADEVRSILDGHIILSRKLGEMNHYPAIDVLASKSRVMTMVTTKEHQQVAGKLRSILAKYQDIEFLVRVGEYKKGQDREGDYALDRIEKVNNFLKQSTDEFFDFENSLREMKQIIA